jgi:RNA polymerase sigma-70 factor (ECF subfamily)
MEKDAADDFGTLFRQHHKSLCNLAYNIVSDADAAKDIVQEVFLRLWKNRDQLIFGEQITHYLFKATAHTSYNYLRSNKKISPLQDYAGLEKLAMAAGTERVEYQELEVRVRKAVENLPPKCKAIYILSRHEGLRHQQIADTLGLSVKTVENQMGIALEKLRNELKPFLSLEFLATAMGIGISLYRLFFF